MQIEPIAHIHTDFPTKFGVPRQSGLASELTSTIVFAPAYRKSGLPAWHCGFFAPVADLAVFGSGKRYLVADGKTAATWRKYQDGSICNTISVSSE